MARLRERKMLDAFDSVLGVRRSRAEHSLRDFRPVITFSGRLASFEITPRDT